MSLRLVRSVSRLGVSLSDSLVSVSIVDVRCKMKARLAVEIHRRRRKGGSRWEAAETIR